MATNGEFGLDEIGQIAVTVSDLDQATRFYRDVLGMELTFEAPGMTFFRCGDIRLMLGRSEDDSGGGPSHIVYYRVADIEAASEALRARGLEFTHEPHVVYRTDESELWLAFLRDPDDHVLGLMSEVPRQGG